LEVTVVNLKKNVTPPIEQLVETECSLVAPHTRSAHPVGRCMKDRGPDQQYSEGPAKPAAPSFVLRLEELPATPVYLARIRKRVEEINRQLQQAELPFRLRVM
jgi:hypothetical protein